MSKLSYRPDIDGLRAIAVLAVLIYHTGLGFPGGYVGVDVFFVISGYLITSLIVKDLQAGTFSFPHFWERRVRRILPAQVVMVATTLAVGACFLFPTHFEDLAKSAAAQTVMAANFRFSNQVGYFDGPAELKPLLHTWSLSVEEQFYLLLPLLLVLSHRYFRHGRTTMLAGLTLASFALSVWGVYAFPASTYFLLPTRAWEMLLGSLLAVGTPGRSLSSRFRTALGWLGLCGIAVACIWYDQETAFPGAAALLPCLGAAAFLFANTADLTSSGRVLAKRPWVMIGRMSYSLYLWHWPVLALLRISHGVDLPVELSLIAVAVSLALAWLSWKFVETPFRTAVGLSRRKAFGMAVACSLLIIVVSQGIVETEGLAARFPKNIRDVLESARLANVGDKECLNIIGKELPAGQTGTFLLWGDSHAQAISEVIDHLAEEQGISGYCRYPSGVVPVPGIWSKKDSNQSAMDLKWDTLQFIKDHHIQHVILASYWTSYLVPKGRKIDLVRDENTEVLSPELAIQVLRRGLKRMVADLDKAGVTVWILRQVPEQKESSPPELLAKHIQFGLSTEIKGTTLREYLARQSNVNTIFDELQRSFSNVRVLDPIPYCFDQAGFSRICNASHSYYRDDDHLSEYGADVLMTPLFQPVIQQISREVAAASGPPERVSPRIQQVSVKESVIR